MAQALCTRPTALPRWRALIISAISTEPTDHSPPKPSPCSARVTNSCSGECVKPLRKVKALNHSTVTCSMRTRPYRSARMPASQPPMAEVISAPVAM
jgi:hypothetical protein